MQRLTSTLPRGLCKRFRFPTGAVAALATASLTACQSPPDNAPQPAGAARAETLVIQSPPGLARPPYKFGPRDEQLLDDVQRGAFLFLWNAASPTTGMVVDRSSVTFASIAGVGFQLAALPIGVERGWVSRDHARARAEKILTALEANPDNRKAGLFYHFLTAENAGPVPQDLVSTIDSALFFAGALSAAAYFGGDVKARADRLFADADWTFFIEHAPRPHEPHMKGFMSLGWQPASFTDPRGKGSLRHYYWADCGDEHRLIYFLAASATRPEHRLDPAIYYRLRRPLGQYADTGPMVYLPWSGALFTAFFAHCFIDYASMGPDDPAAHGAQRRPRVDWWENSRRHVALHRIKAREHARRFPTLRQNAWGLTACDVPDGYGVPGVYPDALPTTGLIPEVDYPRWTPKDDFAGGVLGCYGAGCAIMFEPEAALAALHHYRSLTGPDSSPLVWREPSDDPARNAYGFLDSFNSATNWVAKDYVAIDQGPLILAIENARSGLVWNLFASHDAIRLGAERLGLPLRPRH